MVDLRVAALPADSDQAERAEMLVDDRVEPRPQARAGSPLRQAAIRGDMVPFMALERQHSALAAELRDAFDRVARRSAFILGEEVASFESEFARFCSARHCVGVASGTAALTIALLAAGVGPGDEVIVPAHTFVSSALAVVHAGATVVFCDVEPTTGLIDPAAAAAAVGPRTVALLPVHLYGQACEMDAIHRLARRHGLLVVEDAAQAHGATYRGRPVGGLGNTAAFSFYPSKNLGALGDGGAICTDDEALAERARRIRNVGQQRKGEHVELGFNERLDGLQAALLRVKLPHLAAGNSARRRHARLYREHLDERLLLRERPHTPCVYHLFPILVSDRDAIGAALTRAGIQTAVHYDRAASDHPLWRSGAEQLHPRGGYGIQVAVEDRPVKGGVRAGADLEAARHWAAHELSLPMFAELSEHEVARVIRACTELGLAQSRASDEHE